MPARMIPVPIFSKEMPTGTPRQLLSAADDALRAAATAIDERGRHSCAHLAVLRATAAVVAAKANPVGRPGPVAARLTIQELAILVAPELEERINHIVDDDPVGDDLLAAVRGLIVAVREVCAS